MDTTTTPAADEAAPTTTARPAGVYARRRMLRNAAVAVVAVGALAWFAGPGLTTMVGTDPATAGPALADPARPGTDGNADSVVVIEQERALAHLGAYGSLDDWQPAKRRVLAAAGGDDAVIAAFEDGRCVMGGILDGQPTDVTVDETDVACTAAEVAAAQAVFDANPSAPAVAARAAAAELLAPGVEAARYWASTTYYGGEPSFAGMPGELIAGVTTHPSNSGRTVRLEARTAGACVAAVVDIDGAVRDADCRNP